MAGQVRPPGGHGVGKKRPPLVQALHPCGHRWQGSGALQQRSPGASAVPTWSTVCVPSEAVVQLQEAGGGGRRGGGERRAAGVAAGAAGAWLLTGQGGASRAGLAGAGGLVVVGEESVVAADLLAKHRVHKVAAEEGEESTGRRWGREGRQWVGRRAGRALPLAQRSPRA